MKREDFLANVKQAVIAGRPYRVPTLTGIPANAGYVGGGPNLCHKLAAEVNAVGGFAEIVEDGPAAREALKKLLHSYAPTSALCWQHPTLAAIGVADLLCELHIESLSYDSLCQLPPAEQRTKMLAAEIGITSATYAIAETGSLAMAAGTTTERSASLLPPVHVAIVTAAQILPDLFDLFTRQVAAGANEIAPNLTLITGPSKTGDIELQLTTGVHGPGHWHVIIVRN